jgi:hypothetical protein
MFFMDLLTVLLISMVLTAVFVVGIRKYRAAPVILSFFIILFLCTWAVSAWITAGPLWGMPRLSYVLVGILFALLLTVLIPLSRYAGRGDRKVKEEKEIAILTFDFLFWILVIGLIIAIGLRYVKTGV